MKERRREQFEQASERASDGQSESREDTRIIVGSGGFEREDLTRRQMGDGKKRHFGRGADAVSVARSLRRLMMMIGRGGAERSFVGLHVAREIGVLRQMPRKATKRLLSADGGEGHHVP